MIKVLVPLKLGIIEEFMGLLLFKTRLYLESHVN